jgi:hypothetical protein
MEPKRKGGVALAEHDGVEKDSVSAIFSEIGRREHGEIDMYGTVSGSAPLSWPVSIGR